MDEPGILNNESRGGVQQKKEAKPKENLASILALGIIFGFLFILFAIIIILINLIPGDNKLLWLLTEATIGNWILLVGAGLLVFFFALVVSIYIWKKGRGFLLERI
ncbi:MAG: hypothetical protein LUQ65_00360 [Candidatus Helarchaeota archaeon]|nr:hypothetical protein [Candidatus Helarchaeota archaeon]